jgi:hypothetical protein
MGNRGASEDLDNLGWKLLYLSREVIVEAWILHKIH